MRTIKIQGNKLDSSTLQNISTFVLCCNSMGRSDSSGDFIKCNTRCAKFRIAERDYKDLAIMPKNPTKYCYCGTDIIGELI